MTESLKDAMRKAYRDQGLDLPTQKPSNVTSAKPRPQPKAKSKNGRPRQFARKPQNATSRRHVAQLANRLQTHQVSQEPILIDCPTIQQSKPKPTQPLPKHTADDYRLEVASGAKLAFKDSPINNFRLLDTDFLQDHATQCHGAIYSDEREIALGLDFGTSSVKVVIGDFVLEEAFAVPFTVETGIGRYLLPCRIYEADGVFSLQKGQRDYRDLKLSLIADPTNLTLQKPVIAFLAFIIRHARAWLFHEHKDKYRNTRIVWRLKIGLPVAHHLDQSLSNIFAKIGQIAWFAANMPGEITATVIDSARARHNTLKTFLLSNPDVDDDIEIDIVPEIAAQIYGFVKSNQFDKDAVNLYLMVDVGAGTVDSSLFQVKPAKAGRLDFEFFTSVVEPLGVMNLHRHRINWWQTAFQKNTNYKNLLPSLEMLKFQTDREIAIPDCYSRYFEGVKINFLDHQQTPDAIFFGKVCEQVRTRTYWETWSSGLLTQSALRNIPTFYCGGGTRMPFYKRLRDRLTSVPNCTWLNAIPRRIECPKILKAPGLPHQDFDRLTVAYGLSFLDVGKIIKAIPQPKQISPCSDSWRDNYIDK